MPSLAPQSLPHHDQFYSSSSLYWAIFLGQGVAAPFQRVLQPEKISQIASQAMELGLGGIVLYPFQPAKDQNATALKDTDGILHRGIVALRKAGYEGTILVDLCVCQYLQNAQCRLMTSGQYDEASTIKLLVDAGVALVESGANALMPSACLPSLTSRLRAELNRRSFPSTLLIPQSAKFQSSLYQYFRKTMGHGEQKISKPYQISPECWDAALEHCRNDLEGGANAVLVKPALQKLESLSLMVESLPAQSVGAFLTSGEHGLLTELAAKTGTPLATLHTSVLHALQTAGASFLVTYQAPEFSIALAKLHHEQKISKNN